MNKINYLVGKENLSNQIFQPYDSLICDFLADLSSKIKLDKRSINYPDLITFAFWCRKANINKLKNNLDDRDKRIGLGKVFHISPSNVPINFAFSYVFGLLAGNANIVRVPSREFSQVNIVCDCLNKLFNNKKYKKISDMTSFVRYERDNQITTLFSEKSNGRVIWGGDETVRNIRQLPSNERCVDLIFSDRYSLCVIDQNSINTLNEDKLNKLAERFYNDTYLMDQNACSSPHLIIWLGKNNKNVKEKFWKSIHNIVSEKYKLETINIMDKYVGLCQDAIELDGIESFTKINNLIYRVEMNDLPKNINDYKFSCGFFYEYTTDNLNNIASIINNKYQTLTYFGVDTDLISSFIIKNSLLGIDRVVPIGQALDIGVIWDGYDIIRRLSRIIDIK